MKKDNETILPKEITEKGEKFRLKINGIEFAFEKRLYKKLQIMCDRIIKKHPTLDACLANDGYEGDGKTNSSLVEAIIAQAMIKDTSIHLFFKTSSCIDFAKKTERKIIILDEPSFESLSTDSTTKLNKDFLRLTSTMRKKRHFFIINFAKFWKFPEFLIVDRALGMVHMDSRHGKDPGRFKYIRKRALEKLWNAKKKQNKRIYNKLKSFGGRMPYLMEEIFENFNIQVENTKNATIDDYDKEKDLAIESIGEKKNLTKTEIKNNDKIAELKQKVASIWRHKQFNMTQEQLALALEINSRRLREWEKGIKLLAADCAR